MPYYIAKATDFIVDSQSQRLKLYNKKKTPGLLLVYAKWCPHCHVMLPKFIQTADVIGENTPCLVIEQSDMPSALRVTKFPTLITFDKDGFLKNTLP